MSTQHLVDDAGRVAGDAYRRTLGSLPRSTLLTSAVSAGVLSATAIGLLLYVAGPSADAPRVSAVSSVEIGDCVTVSDGRPVKTACGGDGLTFAVAEKFPGRIACSRPAYARTEADGSSLCLVPNLTVGSCYAVGGPSVATVDLTRIACPSPLSTRTGTTVQVTERASGGPLDCRGATALSYTEPQRISYCVKAVS